MSSNCQAQLDQDEKDSVRFPIAGEAVIRVPELKTPTDTTSPITTPPTASVIWTSLIQNKTVALPQTGIGSKWTSVGNAYTNSPLQVFQKNPGVAIGQPNLIKGDATAIGGGLLPMSEMYVLAQQKIAESAENIRKVYSVILEKIKERNGLIEEGRLIPIKTEVQEPDGKMAGYETYREVILPEGTSVSILNDPTLTDAERKDKLEEAFVRSKPFLGALEDDELLENKGITNEDVTAFMEAANSANNIGEGILNMTIYSTEQQLINIGLNKGDAETIAALNRIKLGKGTEEDLKVLQAGDFDETVIRAANTLLERYKEKPSVFEQITGPAGYLGYKLTVGGPTGFVTAWEVGVSGIDHHSRSIANGMDHTLQEYVRAQGGLNRIIDTQEGLEAFTKIAKNAGYEVFDPRTGKVSKSLVKKFMRSTPKDELERVAEKVIKATGKWHHIAHLAGKALNFGGVLYYGYNMVDHLQKSEELLDTDPQKAIEQYEARKYFFITATETLALASVLNPWAALIIVGAIYVNDYYNEESRKIEADEEARRKRREVALQNGLVPSLYEEGLVATYGEFCSAITKADADSDNDLEIHRYYPTTPLDPRLLTRPDTEASPLEKITPKILDENIRVPTKYINSYNIRDARILNPALSTPENAKIAKDSIKCRCCPQPCPGRGQDPTITQVSSDVQSTIEQQGGQAWSRVISGDCFRAFSNAGYEALYSKQREKNPTLAFDAVEIPPDTNLAVLGEESICSGCFTQDTKISTPIGLIEINKIQVGDSVIAFDNEGNLTESTVIDTFIHQDKIVHEYVFDNCTKIKSTENHPVYTPNGFIEIGKLNVGDTVLGIDGKEIKLTEKTYVGTDTVYNIEVDTYHTYIANNIRVHNKTKSPILVAARLLMMPPPMDPRHSPGPDEEFINHTERVKQEKFDMDPGRYNIFATPEISEGWETITDEEDPLDNPLLPNPKNPVPRKITRRNHYWMLSYKPQQLPAPLITGGSLTTRPGSFGYNYPYDATTLNGVPFPPLQPWELTYAPPYVAISQPSLPSIFYDPDSITQALSGHPFYLTNSEIDLVKTGDTAAIEKTFNGKDPNDKDNMLSYHLTRIGSSYRNSRKVFEDNLTEKRNQFDCTVSKMLV